MSNINWGALASTFETAQQQLAENAPLDLTAGETTSLADGAAAAQPIIAKAATFLTAHPGVVRATLTILGGLKTALGWTWAGEAAEIITDLAAALPKVNADMPMIVGALKAFEPAPFGQPTGATPFDPR